jgi:4-phosphopantoate--beta-alanine ligase
MTSIPPDHPRFESLSTREKLVQGVEQGITGINGLLAHGRGEAFDYLLGEKTPPFARRACRAAAARFLLAEHPVLSVNGNVAALVPDEMVELSLLLNCPVEVNLFYRTEERVGKIVELLRGMGAKKIYGDTHDREIPGMASERGKADSRGIHAADVVLVPLEDGDRTEALSDMGKFVVTVDLNPLSRTARKADITIVDNVVRALPVLVEETKLLKGSSPAELLKITADYENGAVLAESLDFMCERLKKLVDEGLDY